MKLAKHVFLRTHQVTDDDVGENASVDFGMDTVAAMTFSINATGPRSASLVVISGVDREIDSLYTFILSAADRGSPSLTAQTTISITIEVSCCL